MTKSAAGPLSHALKRQVLILSLIGLLGLGGTIVLGLLYSISQLNVSTEVIKQDAISILDSFIQKTTTILEFSIKDLANQAERDARLDTLLRSDQSFLAITLFDPSGGVQFQRKQHNSPQTSLFLPPDWLTTMPDFNKVAISTVHFTANQPWIEMAIAIAEADNIAPGVLVLRIDLSEIWDSLLTINLGESGYVYIVDTQGQVIACRDHQLQKPGNTIQTLIGYSPQTIAQSSQTLYQGLNGHLVFGSAKALKTLPWYTIVEQAVHEIVSPLTLPIILVCAIALLIMYLLISSIRFTQTRIVKPLIALRDAVGGLAKGQLGQTVSVIAKDELGQLGTSFNRMAQQLQETFGKLEQSRSNLSVLIESTKDMIWSVDLNFGIVTFNSVLDHYFQSTYNTKAFLGATMPELLPAERAHPWSDLYTTALEKGPFQIEHSLPDGRIFDLSFHPIIQADKPTGISVFGKDITEQKRFEAQTQRALAEKETLLRELYHRTKNNMNVIIALLEMQSHYFESEELKTAFIEAENRIRSMALVHEKLYETKDLSSINFKDYITNLVELLLQSYSIVAQQVSFVSEMEVVYLSIDIAIPCGLIVNELVSNALKYAFPANRPGIITIGLYRSQQDEIHLVVQDNGIGLAEGFDPRIDGNLGLKNIFMISEYQLNAQITLSGSPGVTCHIQLKDNIYKERI